MTRRMTRMVGRLAVVLAVTWSWGPAGLGCSRDSQDGGDAGSDGGSFYDGNDGKGDLGDSGDRGDGGDSGDLGDGGDCGDSGDLGGDSGDLGDSGDSGDGGDTGSGLACGTAGVCPQGTYCFMVQLLVQPEPYNYACLPLTCPAPVCPCLEGFLTADGGFQSACNAMGATATCTENDAGYTVLCTLL